MIYLAVLAVILVGFLIASHFEEGTSMASIADLSKHIENMKRAQSIVDKAGADASKHADIMDSFEQRLSVNDENMAKLAEYNKAMDAMDSLGNGGPALEATFSSTAAGAPAAPTHTSSSGVGMFTH